MLKTTKLSLNKNISKKSFIKSKPYYWYLFFFVTLLFINNCQTLTDYSEVSKEQIFLEIDEVISKKAVENNFSGNIFVSKNGSIFYNKSFYIADVTRDLTIDNDSKFMIGSITKQFTAGSILVLQDRGLLSVNDTINKYIPNFPYGELLTIHHLLTHTSGLPREPFYDYMIDEIDESAFNKYIKAIIKDKNHLDYITNCYIYNKKKKKYYIKPKTSFRKKSQLMNVLFNNCYISETISKDIESLILELIKKDKLKLHNLPGRKYSYSNFGYMILGHIIEKVSGQDLNSFFIDNIFTPLGMNNTDFGYNTEVCNNFIPGYSDYHEYLPITLKLNIWPSAAGGAYSTINDLNKWIDFLNNDLIISSIQKQSLYEKHTPIGNGYYGYGFIINNFYYENYPLVDINHNGLLFSYNSSIHYFPEPNIKIIILSNNIKKNYIQEYWIKDISNILLKYDKKIQEILKSDNK